ncbi:hypothetical protein ABPG72_000546 [Tetrahymena utriculariae]
MQPSTFSDNQIRKSNTSYKKWIAITLVCLVISFGTCSLFLKGENEQLKPIFQTRNLQNDQKSFQFKYDLQISAQLKQVNGKQISECLKFQSEQKIKLDQSNLEEQSILITYSKLNQQNTLISNKDNQNEIISLMSGKESLSFQAKINKDGDFLEFNSLDENQFEVAQAITKRIISQSIKIFSKSKLPQLQSKRMLLNSTIVYSEVDFFNFSQEQLQYEEVILDPELQVVEEFSGYDDIQKNDDINEDDNQQETIKLEEGYQQNFNDTTSVEQNQKQNIFESQMKNFDQNQQQNNQDTQVQIANKGKFENESFVVQKYISEKQKENNQYDDDGFTTFKLSYKNENSTINDENWDHDGSNFQQESINQQKISYPNSSIKFASLQLKQEDGNSTITDDNWNHDGQNFQQDSYNNHFIDKRLRNSIFKLKLKNGNESITNDNFDHDGTNFQQNSSTQQQNSNQDSEFKSNSKRFIQENQNSTTITDDNWNHDGSNFQQYSGYHSKRLKLAPLQLKQEDENSTLTDDNWNHDGSNFQQDSQDNHFIDKRLRNSFFKLQLKNGNESITNNNFDHDGSNFQQNSSNQQQNSNQDSEYKSNSKRLIQENQNSTTITDDNWNHDGSNFQQDSGYHNKRLKFAPLQLKQEDGNSTVTDQNWNHDSSNFQQDSSSQQQNGYNDNNLKLASQRFMQEDQNSTITNENWDHDGSNFQHDNRYRHDRRDKFATLKLKQEDGNSTVTDENWNHDGSNFQQDSLNNHFIDKRLRNAFYRLKQQSGNENMTHDSWDHDNQNFQQDSSTKQQNDFDNNNYHLTTVSALKSRKDLPHQSKEVIIYKNKIFSQIMELRIIQNIYQDYTKFAYILYINSKQHSQIHETIVNTDSIFACIPKTQPQEQQTIQKIVEINNFIFGVMNIPIIFQLNFLIVHSYEMVVKDTKCDISFQIQVKAEVDSNIGLQVPGQEEKGYRVKGLLINEFCQFNQIVDTQELTISNEIKKQKGEISYSIGQYYRKQICNLTAPSVKAQNIRKSLKSSQETNCHLSDMQDDEENQASFMNKGQDESAVTLIKQIEFIKLK